MITNVSFESCIVEQLTFYVFLCSVNTETRTYNSTNLIYKNCPSSTAKYNNSLITQTNVQYKSRNSPKRNVIFKDVGCRMQD